MSNLVSFLCIAFLAKTSVALPNLSGSENPSAIVTPSTVSATSSSIVLNTGDYRSNYDLANRINTTVARLAVQYSRLLNDTQNIDDEQQANIDRAVRNFDRQLLNIFRQKNESVAEFYKKIRDRECLIHIDTANDKLSQQHTRALWCSLRSTVHAVTYLSRAISTHENVTRDLKHLHSLALTCKDSACDQIVKRLDDLAIDKKLQDIITNLDYFQEVIIVNAKKIDSCLDVDRQLKRYEDNIKADFEHFKHCVVPN